MKSMFVAACVCAAAVAAGQGRPAAVVGIEVPIEVKEAEPRSYVGTVKASERAAVTAQVSGRIWKQNFREGGRVEKGQTLFELEDTVYKANFRQAKANLMRLEAQLALAEKEVVRYRKALEKRAVPENDYDRAVQTRDVCLADIEAAKAAIVLAENNIEYTKVLSPISGVIGETKLRIGNNVGPQSGELVTIVQTDPIDLQFAPSENDFYRSVKGGELKRGIRLGVFRADGTPLKQEAKVDFIDNHVDPSTDTVMVQLVMPNPDGALIPGGYVKITLTEVFEPSKIAVRTSALSFEGEKRFVFVVGADGVARRREIKAGVQLGDLIIVEGGLERGERIVTTGLHKVVDGQPVEVK